MNLYKLNNLIPNNSGICDYRNIDLKKIVFGSLYYPQDLDQNNFCIFQHSDNLDVADLEKLTVEQYEVLKGEILEQSKTKEQIQQGEIDMLKQSISELTLLLAGGME